MSQTQDDVMQLVAAGQFLRSQSNAEAHYYSRVIAEVAQRMLAAPEQSNSHQIAVKQSERKPDGCSRDLWDAGKPAPRTCMSCGLGPCYRGNNE